MKYLGIDYGGKRVGIAISDDAGKIAFPRGVLANDGKILGNIAGIIDKEKIQKIIIGDTLSFSGLENPVTKESDAFVARLKKETGLPIESAWEAGSSVEASRYAPDGSGHDDSAAAAIILQRYLDMHGTLGQ